MEAGTKDLRHFVEILNDYMGDAQKLMERKFNQEHRSATGYALRNLEFKLKTNDNEYVVTFYAPDYYKYIEEGRKSGKMPPQKAILDWIKAKKILPRPDRDGKIPTIKTLAFLIARAIGKHGTIKDKHYKGTNYLADTIEELNDKYLPRLQEALERDVEEYSIEIFDKIGEKLISIF